MTRTAVSAAAIALLFSPLANGDELDTMTENCNGCHGPGGVSQWSDVPSIAGIDAFVHSEALYVYRDEARPCTESAYRTGDTSRPATTMCSVAADLSDDDIESLAEHYAGMDFVPAEQEFSAELAEQGQAIHDRDCELCHSAGGSDAQDEASILAGQWMGYLRQSFSEYRSGDREQLPRMRELLDALSDEEVEALVHFYASKQ